MKERIQGIIIGIVITLFLIGTLSFASHYSEYVERFYKNIKITLNGINIEPKDVNGNIVEPFIIDGTTYLPVRAICKALGLEVNWNSETNTVELIEEKYNEISTEKNDTPIVSIKTQYAIENNDVIEKKMKRIQLMLKQDQFQIVVQNWKVHQQKCKRKLWKMLNQE